MKQCSKCGIQFETNRLSCPRCGGAPVNGYYNYNYNYNYSSKKAKKKGNKRHINWYESIWFIVVCICTGLWPLAAGMIALRCCRNSNYYSINKEQTSVDTPQSNKVKNRGVGNLVGGIITGSTGLLVLFFQIGSSLTSSTLNSLAVGGALLGVGIMLICMFIEMNKTWHQYVALIDNRGNTRISSIANKLSLKQDKVRNTIQKLINKGLLDEPENSISAYINGEYDLVVMTRNGKPIVPVEKTMAEEIAAKKAREEEARMKAEVEAEAARRQAPGSAGDELLICLEDALAFADDSDVKAYLKTMEDSLRGIMAMVTEEPTLKDKKSIINMETSYIPSTISLIQKYLKPNTSEAARMQIKGMFATLSTAFSNLEKQLSEQDDMDTEVDIEVMKQALVRDGLLGSDFDIK